MRKLQKETYRHLSGPLFNQHSLYLGRIVLKHRNFSAVIETKRTLMFDINSIDSYHISVYIVRYYLSRAIV